jgi:hypothetical protein
VRLKISFNHIAPFLNVYQNKAYRWLGYIGLGVGVLLLLCCIQMYINIDQLLKDKNSKNNGFDFISVTKTITNENMGKDNRFTDDDIKEIQSQPFIEGAAPLKANAFKVNAGAGDAIPFSTYIFIEALNNNFIDTVPASFSWKEGQEEVPIIFSSDFLEMYNVFAPSWNLPQLSEKTATAVNIFLQCSGHNGQRQFKAHIVAFSDRINSILVPESFLDKMNKELEGVQTLNCSRVFLKTKDANNTQLLNYLEQKNYHVNKDKTRFGRIKQVLQNIIGGLTGFGILIILLAMVLFSFYLQLMIARSKENLQLLLTLGYSPKWLSKTVAKKWIPVYIIVVSVTVIITEMLQWSFQYFALGDSGLVSPFISWIVILVAVLLVLLGVLINYKLINKLLNKL